MLDPMSVVHYTWKEPGGTLAVCGSLGDNKSVTLTLEKVTLNHSTNGIASKWYVVGFKPTRGCLPDPMLTTLSTTPPMCGFFVERTLSLVLAS
ncbi:hypothetical protein E2C01_091714 [Portunus trituberculatus]|uniref:Uncharacterized protein n=1 Tax=Portunus trituberculatus TaxID=210409 RepID=A0A5B7JPD5_PORTR|nr:hypothetical protein [Portunus trituberculatus]